MKYARPEAPGHAGSTPHHWVGAWFGVVALLLAVLAAAVYWLKRCRSSYRRKRRVTRRAQSAAELNPNAVASANKRLSFRIRSSSTEAKDEHQGASSSAVTPEDTERTPLVTQKIDSLAKLLFHRSLGGNKTSAGGSGSPTEPSRHGGRYQYSALDATADSGSHERLELERRAREGALSVCHQYLGGAPRYELLRHLNDIGSRFDKHWFVVRDVSVKTDRLLSLVPRCRACPIECTQESRELILELFQSLQHPYIYPVLDFEFTECCQDDAEIYAVLVMPFHTEGSLKDLIYGSSWQEDWSHKYDRRSPGLPLSQIQRLGRQILEALLFLRERGFPPYGHLHSGNVILQNGVARLTGLENTLLGYTSRIHSVVWKRARQAPSFVDTICFGHVLFEMSAGYELNAAEPSPGHLQLDLERYPQVAEVLELIFEHPECRYPSIEELLVCDLFRNIDLREMRGAPLAAAAQRRPSHRVRCLLDDVRRPRRACSSEPSSPLARDRRPLDGLHRVFSSDDCSLPAAADDHAVQHRELTLHLVRREEVLTCRPSHLPLARVLSGPLCPSSPR